MVGSISSNLQLAVSFPQLSSGRLFPMNMETVVNGEKLQEGGGGGLGFLDVKSIDFPGSFAVRGYEEIELAKKG